MLRLLPATGHTSVLKIRNRVLMVGSDEHGTPITVTAETQGISPQEVVDISQNQY